MEINIRDYPRVRGVVNEVIDAAVPLFSTLHLSLLVRDIIIRMPRPIEPSPIQIYCSPSGEEEVCLMILGFGQLQSFLVRTAYPEAVVEIIHTVAATCKKPAPAQPAQAGKVIPFPSRRQTARQPTD